MKETRQSSRRFRVIISTLFLAPGQGCQAAMEIPA